MIHRLPIILAILPLAAALSTLSVTAQTMLDRLDGLYYPQGYGAWDCQTLGMDGGAVGVRDGMLHGVESSCRLDNGKAFPALTRWYLAPHAPAKAWNGMAATSS